MKQSSIIFAVIMIGFIIFITMRSELASYLKVLGINASSTSSTSAVNALQEVANT